MSRLTDLLRQAAKLDAQLSADLAAEFTALTKRRTFGLVFERHQPEAVELPGCAVRRGDKVRVLPPRGTVKAGDQRLWRITSIARSNGQDVAHLEEMHADDREKRTVAADDLVVVAEFRDSIYPGLVETGRVERGGDKPYHTVINAENYHALEMLTYTHRHAIDAIYIDPPYNTGAKDWKYNNDYVASDDDYRHSKWLAMMERRLKVARELLNPDDSVLIVTIDEKEYLRLGLLLDQTFPQAEVQMVTSVMAPQGSQRPGQFSRMEEYIYFVMLGSAHVVHGTDQMIDTVSGGRSRPKNGPSWDSLIRRGTGARRSDRPGMFYPIYVRGEVLVAVGDSIVLGASRDSVASPFGADVVVVWPIRTAGAEGRWQVGPERLRELFEAGYARVGKARGTRLPAITYLKAGEIGRLESPDETGTETISARSVWNRASHNAGSYGSTLLRALMHDRQFPFPKSLYAVEDSLRFFVANKPNAIILDFFSGSGTTAHAVMRLNKQDGGRRQCIMVTNNEVSAEEQTRLRKQGLRPGDPEWESLGICDYITKPRVTAAITGQTPGGEPIKGDYKFTDEFPMADGFAENAAFFTLTYETPLSVRHNRAFQRVAPMLWLRAGSRGRMITDLGEHGWDVADTYAVLEDMDRVDAFIAACTRAADIGIAFIITDDARAFEMVCRELPEGIVTVQLYTSYMQNFEINTGRSL